MSRATREAYGQTLVELVNEGHDIVAVDADLAGSTKLADLQKAFPQRMVDVGIAEQNMVGVASGLSLTGRTVFTGSFAVFATGRAYDQIRNTVCDSGLNVKICPTHAGITVGEDGATHQSLEDIGMMRALPQMRVLVPADYNATKAALRLAAEADGPFYVRMGRHKVADIYDESFKGGLPLQTFCARALTLPLLPAVLKLLRHLPQQICWQRKRSLPRSLTCFPSSLWTRKSFWHLPRRPVMW